MTKVLQHLRAVLPAVVLAGTGSVAAAGTTLQDAGVIVCVNDKWDEKELEKGHKRVDYAGRCVKVPDDQKAAKMTEDCSGQYEYLPDGSWTAKGACTAKNKDGDTISSTWEEGSQLQEYTFTATGGTGKYKDAGGGGTYKYDQLTDTLFGGRYVSKWEVP